MRGQGGMSKLVKSKVNFRTGKREGKKLRRSWFPMERDKVLQRLRTADPGHKGQHGFLKAVLWGVTSGQRMSRKQVQKWRVIGVAFSGPKRASKWLKAISGSRIQEKIWDKKTPWFHSQPSSWPSWGLKKDAEKFQESADGRLVWNSSF